MISLKYFLLKEPLKPPILAPRHPLGHCIGGIAAHLAPKPFIAKHLALAQLVNYCLDSAPNKV